MKNKRSIRSAFKNYIIISVIFFLLIICFTLVFLLLYLKVEANKLFVYLGLSLDAFCILICAIVLTIFTVRLSSVFYKDMYTVTNRNIKKLTNNEKNLELFNSIRYEEIQNLNDSLVSLNTQLDKNLLLSKSNDYSSLDLDYEDRELSLVKEESFHKKIIEIVSQTNAYRNILLQGYYEFENDAKLSPEESKQLLLLLKQSFEGYDNLLFSMSSLQRGIYCYIPMIDSISDVKDRMSSIQKDASLIRQKLDGNVEILPLKFAFVCYPFSNIEDLFSDIHFAMRMPNMINGYLPNRVINMSDNKLIMREAMNLNNMTKILSTISSLSSMSSNPLRELKTSLNNLNAYLNIDTSGVAILDELSSTYHVLFASGNNKINCLSEGNEVYLPLVLTLDDIKDNDQSYFASNRKHVYPRLGEIFDRNGIQSGFFYIIHDGEKKLRGLVYFVNSDKDMPIDSYLRETLYVIASRIGDYTLSSRRISRLKDEENITAALLKLSDYCMYKINPNNYQLTHISDGIKDALYGSCEVGDLCYKTLFKKDSPCEKCPLFTGKKMKEKLEPYKVEVSMTLNTDKVKQDECVMLIKRVRDDSYIDEPYDHDLLVNSYYALIQSMKNAYLLSSRGYLLLLKIDNLMELLQKYGSEPINKAMRIFANRIREEEKVSNVYYFKPDCFALLLSDYGQNDIINKIEAIYELNKESFFEDTTSKFSITYLPISYPQGYPSEIDFLRHCENYYLRGKYETKKNFIYFDENGYSRSASKNDFMLSVIDDKFSNKDFTVSLQPILNSENQKIVSAELLLRLADEYRKITFNTDELIKVAAKNGKIGLISSSLLEFLGELYQKYGVPYFKPYGFNSLTINTDYSYLADEELSTKIEDMLNKYHMPSDFLGFEITEKEIYDHYDDMKKFTKNITSIGVKVICDRYSGEYLSFDRLKDLGVSQFKIDRKDTMYIDTDKNKYLMVKSLLEAAKPYEIKACLIGVENMIQFKMIKEIDPSAYVQGFAFYRPLESHDLVETIRKNNSIIRTIARDITK